MPRGNKLIQRKEIRAQSKNVAIYKIMDLSKVLALSPSSTKTRTFLNWFTYGWFYRQAGVWKVVAKYQLDATPPCQSGVVREQTNRNTDCKASLRLAAYNNSIVCLLIRINRVSENNTSLPLELTNSFECSIHRPLVDFSQLTTPNVSTTFYSVKT